MDFYHFSPDTIKLIDVQTIGRASSDFFQGILDGHPQIVTLPRLNSIRDCDAYHKKPEEIALYIYRHVFQNAALTYIKNPDILSYQKFQAPFCDYLNQYGISRKNILIALYYAYAVHFHPNISSVEYLCYSGHNYQRMIDIATDFPRRKTIFLVRDPRASFYSMRDRSGLYAWSFHILHVMLNYSGYYKLLAKIAAQDTLLVRHEDLHLSFDRVKASVLDFLHIEYDPSMETSSFFNMPYDGSSSPWTNLANHFSTRPDPKYVHEKWKAHLHPLELFLVQITSSELMRFAGYPRISRHKCRNNQYHIDWPCEHANLWLNLGLFGKRNKCFASWAALLSHIPLLGELLTIFVYVALCFYTYVSGKILYEKLKKGNRRSLNV